MLHVAREYQGNFQEAGVFQEVEGGHYTFSYSKDYLDSPQVHALSQSLPLRSDPYTADDYQGFFEGMAPEGVMRTELAHSFHLSPSNYIKILEHLGNECVGALLFHADDREIDEPSYQTFSSEELAQLQERPFALSLSTTHATRLSLAGAQTKFGIYVDESAADIEPMNWFKPLGSAPSTHIVKIADDRFSSLPFNELACMQLAHACGLPTPEVFVPSTCPNVFVVSRYDRDLKHSVRTIDGHNVPLRLHQEDFCQIYGWPPYLKYEMADILYARIAGRIISNFSSDAIADRALFAKSTLLNYLVGNCDNHLKNCSLLYSADWETHRLSPVYDIVCTTLLGFDRKMGFSIGGHILIDEITTDDWMLFAEDIKLNLDDMQNIITEMLEIIPQASEQAAAALPAEGVQELESILEDMKPRLKALT